MDIKRCLIVDTETTGFDPKKDTVIEIGAILYSLEANTHIASVSTLIPADSNAAEEINTISVASLSEVTDPLLKGFGDMLWQMVQLADVFVAHQASFDKSHLTGEDLNMWSQKPWICTREDFRFRRGKPGDSLVNTALAHGIGVSHNHRALTDCQLIARIFGSYATDDLRGLFAHALLPRNYYVANTKFDQRELPKAAGFSWNPERKMWWKKLTDAEAAAITTFSIRRIEPRDLGIA